MSASSQQYIKYYNRRGLCGKWRFTSDCTDTDSEQLHQAVAYWNIRLKILMDNTGFNKTVKAQSLRQWRLMKAQSDLSLFWSQMSVKHFSAWRWVEFTSISLDIIMSLRHAQIRLWVVCLQRMLRSTCASVQPELLLQEILNNVECINEEQTLWWDCAEAQTLRWLCSLCRIFVSKIHFAWRAHIIYYITLPQ